tara:strand:+ start:127 stop:651 length:525 start_codon:yes stop_codon:yes gene_type:complete
MAVTESSLSQRNFLQPNGYQLTVYRKRFQNLEFFAQRVSHPTITMNPSLVPFKRTDTKFVGDTLEFGELNVEVLLDEQMAVYTEIQNWMESIVNTKVSTPSEGATGLGVATTQDLPEYDIRLSILNSNNNVAKTVLYKSCFPISLGTVEFAASVGAIEYVVLPVTFAYTTFTMT